MGTGEVVANNFGGSEIHLGEGSQDTGHFGYRHGPMLWGCKCGFLHVSVLVSLCRSCHTLALAYRYETMTVDGPDLTFGEHL